MSDDTRQSDSRAARPVLRRFLTRSLREPGKVDPSRDFVRSFVTGQRHRRVSFYGKKEMERLVRRARTPVWLEVMSEAGSGTLIPGVVTRALMTLIPQPYVIILPPGVPRSSGILGRAYDCGGIRTWNAYGLERQIAAWTGRRRHVVALLRAHDKAPVWLDHRNFGAELVRARLMRVGALSGWSITIRQDS